MKKIRVLGCTWTEDDVEFLSTLGIKLKGPGSKNICFEEDERYPEIKNRIMKDSVYGFPRKLDEYYGFEYSKEDILSSEYCILDHYCNTCGYPQPERNFEYKTLVYDGDRLCRKCFCGLHQKSDFRINKIPTGKLSGFTAWVYDVLFVKDDLYKDVFEPLGIGCRPVRTPAGKLREGIVQLDIPIIEEDLNLVGHEYSLCPTCGQKKYSPRYKYPFFPLHEEPLPHIYYSKELFGYDGESFRKIYFSTSLALKLISLKVLKYHCFIPCKRNLDIPKLLENL